MKMKLLLLTFGSVVLTGMVVASAFYQKKQFYPSVIYITKSSISMAAMYFQAFVFMVLVSKLLSKIFFGQLRPTEIEHLVERMWYAITETCLAFTVFREDFSPKFVAMFTILLFFKCFHWLAEDRVDFMERSPVIPVRFHVRMIGLITMLLSIDYFFILYAYNHTLEKGATAQLVFGFEYTILKLSLIVITCRYILHTIDSRRETPWDQKATFMLYIDLISNFLKLVFYVLFLVLMIKVHIFPLFIIRPVYLSMRSFKKTVQDLILSRKAIHYMNTVFKTATAEDLANTDTICIICREEMIPAGGENSQSENNRRGRNNVQDSNVPKCLPCGHIFHCACLKTWFQRQQTCPTCRMDILRNVNSNTGAANQAGAPGAGGNAAGSRNNRQSSSAPSGNSSTTNATGTTNVTNEGSTPSAPFSSTPGFLPPNVLPPFPAPFPWMMPPPPATTTTSTNSSDQQAQNIPNFLASPFGGFMFPGMPMFTRPMPELTSSELAKLTDEELKKLEKQGREGMEFRVKTLQQIHTLLDAAVLLMNAYMMSVQNTSTDSNQTSAVNNAEQNDQAKGDKPEVTKNSEIEKQNEEIPKEEDIENINAKSDLSFTPNKEEDGEEETQLPSSINNIETNDEIMKLRDRRLKKFQQTASTSNINNDDNITTTNNDNDDKSES